MLLISFLLCSDINAPYNFDRTQLIIEQAEEGFLANLALDSETSKLLTES